jgi:hypothetical protein
LVEEVGGMVEVVVEEVVWAVRGGGVGVLVEWEAVLVVVEVLVVEVVVVWVSVAKAEM